MELLNSKNIQIILTIMLIIISFYKELRIHKLFNLTSFGLFGTFFYIYVLVVYLDIDLKDIAELRRAELNENGLVNLGIFLGGVFSPIAFFWLIIGYLLQNKEITLARNDYNRSLKLSKESFDHQFQQYNDFKIEEHNKNQPRLVADKGRYENGNIEHSLDHFIYIDVELRNHGATIYHFDIDPSYENDQEISANTPIEKVEADKAINIRFYVQTTIFDSKKSMHILKYSYEDQRGQNHESILKVRLKHFKYNSSYNLALTFTSNIIVSEVKSGHKTS